jgi:hypothetical protein
MHGEGVRLDGNANDASVRIGSLDCAAAVADKRCEAAALALPHHIPAPAQLATDIGSRQADHLEPR